MRRRTADKTARPRRRRRPDRTPLWIRLILLPTLAFLLTLFLEWMSRGSIGKAFVYLGTQPLYYLYNVLIVLTSLVFSELFKHRRSVLFLVSAAWLGLGIAAHEVVKARTQPFTSMDILVVKDAIKLTTIYYTWPQIIAMYGGILLALIAVIWIVTRLPKRRRVNYGRAATVFGVLTVLCVCLASIGVSTGWFPRYYDNLVSAYHQYGFATCFTFTFGDRGVKAPTEYSAETVTDIVDNVADQDAQESAASVELERPVFDEDDDLAHPNVILLQLESLFDVNTVLGARYDSDPTPTFNRLSREYPSGELYVPSIGGGTVNVEFEVLTGMNLDFFGVGEYPYNTLLQTETCETLAYNLKAQGYSTTAMHDNTATFYSRYLVYPNMGFDHFVSIEYMPYATYNSVGWCQDILLADEIPKALRTTDKRDFVMTVAVESHGKYDETYTYTEGDPEVLSLPEEISSGPFCNYVHVIHVVDQFIETLIRRLENFDEPTIVVMYGDHLPALGLTDELLSTGNLYASRYVIWNNYGAQFEAPNLQAYRLGANLLKQLGYSGGVITKLHQAEDLSAADDAAYLEKLQVLEYDLIAGDKSGYENGQNPYLPVKMTMGVAPIGVTGVSAQYGRLLVIGQNFTEQSVIMIDGAAWPTAFVNDSQIITIVPRGTPIGSVEVAQVASDGTELSRTEPYEVTPAA